MNCGLYAPLAQWATDNGHSEVIKLIDEVYRLSDRIDDLENQLRLAKLTIEQQAQSFQRKQYALCECGRERTECATYEDPDADHDDKDRPTRVVEKLPRSKKAYDDRDPMHSGA